MKTNVIYLILFLLVTSCTNDTGNYDYISAEELLPIEITGMNEDATVVQGSQLQIDPQIEKMDDPSRYTYLWYTTEAQIAGALPTKKELSKEPKLDVKITLDAGSYLLNLIVLDEKKDIYKRKQIKLEVKASNISIGWYVLKDMNQQTDFDFVDPKGVVYSDVLAQAGNQLQGNAVAMSYQSSRYYHQVMSNTGVITQLTNQKVFHVLSTRDIRTFNAQNMGLFKKFDEQFYALPSQCMPQLVYSQGTDGNVFLINAGKLHSIDGMSFNIGKFCAPKVGEYSLFPVLAPANFSGDMLVFDTLKHTFYTTSSVGMTVDNVPDQVIGKETIHMRNMPYQMIAMTSGLSYISMAKQSFAIMKNTDDGSYRLAQIPYNTSNRISSFNPIPNNANLTHSNIIAATSSGNFLYFAINNQIYYYMNATGLDEKEKLLITLPQDEKVTFMLPILAKDMNVLAVLANTATSWKLYIYPVEAVGNPELVTKPLHVYTGKGAGKQLLYRDK